MGDLYGLIGKDIIRYKPAVVEKFKTDNFTREPVKLLGIIDGRMQVALFKGTLEYIKKTAKDITEAIHAKEIIDLLDLDFSDDGWMEASQMQNEEKTALSVLEGKFIHQVGTIDKYDNGFMDKQCLLVWARKYHMKIRYDMEILENVGEEKKKVIKTLESILDYRYCNPELWEEIII